MAQFIGFGNGHDGSVSAASGTVNTYAAATGTAGQTVITTDLAANAGDIVLIQQTQHATNAGKWELAKVASDAGATLNIDRPLVNTYASKAQAILVPQYTAGTCANALTATSWNRTSGGIVAIICNGLFTLSGSIAINGGNGSAKTSSGYGGRGTGGGFYGGDANGSENATLAYQGESSITFDSANQAAGYGGGGGGANLVNRYGAGGGGAGYGANGSNGASGWGYYGYAGLTYGNAALTLWNLGSGGGGGKAGGGSSGTNYASGGGSGGGAVLIIARQFTLTGTITTTGGNGANAGCSTSDSTVSFGGGGGGSGGAILIKAQVATLGTARATAAAGTGGTTKKDNEAPVTGGNGGVGRIHLDYLVSYTGTTTPTIDVAQDTTLVDDAGGAFLYNMI